MKRLRKGRLFAHSSIRAAWPCQPSGRLAEGVDGIVSSCLSLRRLAAAMIVMATAHGSALAVTIDLIPHRADYALSLLNARPQSGIEDVQGRMSFSWNDSCDGWTLEQRFHVRFDYGGDEDVDLSSYYASWEAKDGASYRFYARKLSNGEQSEEISGKASLRAEGGGEAVYDKPAVKTLALPPGTVFPAAHTRRLLAGVGGRSPFLAMPIFDGSETDGLSIVTAVLGRQPLPSMALGRIKAPELLASPAWRASLAFFPLPMQEEWPDYETSMALQENGIVRSIDVDYGDFRVRMILENLTPLPRAAC
jgi:EipB-like